MLVYVVDYDKLQIVTHDMGDVCDLAGFNSEMDSMFDEWFDDLIDAEYELQKFRKDSHV
jgi:hypothetical protein